jgi:DNA repair protein RadC
VIIETADRPALPGQILTNDLFLLWKEFRNDKQRSLLKPTLDAELTGKLSEIGAKNIRTKVFTDPDLIASSDFWMAILQQIRKAVSDQTSDSEGHSEILRKFNDLQAQMSALPPTTPPIQMTTAGFSPFRGEAKTRPVQVPNLLPTQIYLPPIEIRENPGERLRFFGADYLRSSELLSLLLQSDPSLNTGENPESTAARILSEYGTRALTAERNPGRMAELLGVSLEVASRVVAILELGRRFFEETATRTPFIRSPEDAFKYLKDMAMLKKEHLRGLYLNVQSRLIHDEVISIGTLSRSIVHPREVFAPALEHSAFAIILAHNHPSGDLAPSAQDIAVTKSIAEAGRTLGIELLDHIIIGDSVFLSLKKEKLFV